jgi:23S rRNA (adenine2030-N6)-methyltransferase
LNYRHAYHAGNFADVLKHIVLVRVLLHLRAKDAAFRVIETHAGAGRYDLSGDTASRTGEWRDGIGRLLARPLDPMAHQLIEPYLALIRLQNPEGEIRTYPGSPALAMSLARRQDRLLFYEMHPEEKASLARVVGRDPRVKVIEADGWIALKAALPPPERRGVVLIDPSFEQPDEFLRLAEGLTLAHRRWASGMYLLWYPIKDESETEAFARRIAKLKIPTILRLELTVDAISADGPLAACGLIVVNPPWTLASDGETLMPALAHALGRGKAGRYRVDWLTS